MSRILWLVTTSLTVLSLVAAACGQAAVPTPPAPATPTTPTVPAAPAAPTAPAQEKPQQEAVKPAAETPEYGGTFATRLTGDPTAWDPWFGGTLYGMWFETLGQQNWMAIPPETWGFKSRFTPIRYATGKLAESWETKDYQTITFHLRKGVRFQNIPPVNGREMTASDVEFSFNRLLGLGSGFTRPTTFVSVARHEPVASVTAVDKYTVVFKLKTASMSWMLEAVDDHDSGSVLPQEAIKQWGDMNRWDRSIGTGPFIIKDYVPGSYISAVRNPNYFARDERVPQNQLPYVDGVNFLIIPDQSTALAALRTGKLDRLTNITWEDAASLNKTNPQLQQVGLPNGAVAIYMQVDKPPFNDIRVRKALQMSVDLETLAKTYYGGLFPGKPVGLMGFQDYYVPFDEWPQELKDGYLYNPEGAKKLLAEAGYPNGFKTSVAIVSTNVDLMSIIKDYFARIGVDMALDVKESGALTAYVRSGLAPMSIGFAFDTRPPVAGLSYRSSWHTVASPATRINDPVFDEMWRTLNSALDEDEQRKLIREADFYVTKQQWTINLVPRDLYTLYQPWIKRYPPTQEITIGQKMARLWIDQDLKKELKR